MIYPEKRDATTGLVVVCCNGIPQIPSAGYTAEQEKELATGEILAAQAKIQQVNPGGAGRISWMGRWDEITGRKGRGRPAGRGGNEAAIVRIA